MLRKRRSALKTVEQVHVGGIEAVQRLARRGIRFAVDDQRAYRNGEALLVAARAGAGLMLQPAELVEPEIAAGSLVQVLPKYTAPPRPLHLLYAPDRQMTPKLRSVVDFCVAAFGAG
jgi:DNA-binding transcriptional LysR family regulator